MTLMRPPLVEAEEALQRAEDRLRSKIDAALIEDDFSQTELNSAAKAVIDASIACGVARLQRMAEVAARA